MITEKEKRITLAYYLEKRNLLKLIELVDEALEVTRELVAEEIADDKQNRINKSKLEEGSELSESTLAYIAGIENGMKSHYESRLVPDWSLRCSDGATIRTSKSQDILSFENVERRSIQSLEVTCGELGHFQIKVTLDDTTEDNVSYSLLGPDEKVLIYADKVEEFLDSIKAGFNGLYCFFYAPRRVPLSNVFYLIALIILSMSAAGLFDISLMPESRFGRYGMALLLAILGGMYLGAFLLSVFRTYLFPVAIFAINSGVPRAKKYETRRKILLVSVPLAFVVSVTASYLVFLLSG